MGLVGVLDTVRGRVQGAPRRGFTRR